MFPESIGFFEVDHTADIAVAVTGDSIESLFSQSLKALEHIVHVKLLEKILCQLTLSIRANSAESLLIAFLNETLVLLEKDTWLVCDQLKIRKDQLKLSYDLYRCSTHGIEVKAVTYNQVDIIKHQGFFSTMIVFDV